MRYINICVTYLLTYLLWDHSFLSYAADRQTDRITDTQTPTNALLPRLSSAWVKKSTKCRQDTKEGESASNTCRKRIHCNTKGIVDCGPLVADLNLNSPLTATGTMAFDKMSDAAIVTMWTQSARWRGLTCHVVFCFNDCNSIPLRSLVLATVYNKVTDTVV